MKSTDLPRTKQLDTVIVYFGAQDVRAGRSQKKQWLSIDKKTIKTDLSLTEAATSARMEVIYSKNCPNA